MSALKVTFIFDRTYFQQLIAVTNSILKNEKKELADSIEFYLTYFGAEREVTRLIKKFEKNFPNNKFYVRHVPSELPKLFKKYEELYDYDSSAGHIQTSSVLARFDLDKIWPEVTDRILYLDLDLIVRGSISELFDLADKDSIISACSSGDPLCNELRSWRKGYDDPAQFKYYDYNREFRDNFKSIYDDYVTDKSINTTSSDYFFNKEFDFASPALNAGVFILNIEKYKKDKTLRRNIRFLIELNSGGELLRYNDQSILNFAFYGKVDWIDRRWNRMDYGWHNKKDAERVAKEFVDAKIVHYNGWRKPWSFNNIPNETAGDWEKYFAPGVALWKEYQL